MLSGKRSQRHTEKEQDTPASEMVSPFFWADHQNIPMDAPSMLSASGTSRPADYKQIPAILSPARITDESPVMTGTLPSGVTRQPVSISTGNLPALRKTTTPLRQPVIIRGVRKKQPHLTTAHTAPVPGRRHWFIHVVVILGILFVSFATLLAVTPAGNNVEAKFNPFRPIVDWVKGNNSTATLNIQQIAQANTAHHDGYDTYAGGQNTSSGNLPPSGTYDGFTPPQCTYWADWRYHQLTGHYIPWGGNASTWLYGAQQYGWSVSYTPHIPSIVVLQPGVQGAGWYFGHVAVAESWTPDHKGVVASNWNWAGNGTNTQYVNFYPGPGVAFVWYPGF